MSTLRREGRRPVSWRAGFGTRAWVLLHRLADRWPCSRCRPRFSVWVEGLHDAVNVRLGKPLFRAVSFGRFASGELEGRFHATCLSCRVLRLGLRVLARTPWDGGGPPQDRSPAVVGEVGAGNGLREE